MAEEDEHSLENTPSWAFAAVASSLVIVSLLLEYGIHLITRFLRRRKEKSLNQALGNIKAELMMLGFVSLLLTAVKEPISKICISKSLAESFGPCKNPSALNSSEDSSCEAKGKVSFISSDGLNQLQIFIFVLALFHVLHSVLTMALGRAKMGRWKAWEEETRTLGYQVSNDPRRFRLTHETSFGRRHLRFWSNHRLLLWPVSFLRQFYWSLSKADYFILRHGFIMAHFTEGSKFDFQKYTRRALDEDFGVVVGISPWIWVLSIFLIFFKAHVFYSHWWLPFMPFAMVLVVGTKLQVIVTKMCLESRDGSAVVRGTLLVKPHDNLFWFGQPRWLLHLIHFILFQNSFQLAFFTWTWYEFGLKSCFHSKTEEFVIWIAVGVLVQLLCGYVTLPLYALVTQMGSSMKPTVFRENVAKGLKKWLTIARWNLARSRTISTRPSPELSPSRTSSMLVSNTEGLGTSEFDHRPFSTDPASVTIEINVADTHPETYVGEISFARGW